MNEEKIVEYLFEIKSQLSEISANQKNFQTILTNHENRIISLEENNITKKDDDFKTEMLKLIGKCLLIGLTAIASLVGAGGILSHIFGA